MSYLSQFPITSGYGKRGSGFHHGLDLATPTGTPIPALASGIVAFEGLIPPAAPGYSNEIICIVQSDGFFIVYGHLSKTLVNRGQRVEQGQVIAHSGNTGYSTGPHLHIEQRKGTKDPAKGISAYTSTNITPLLEAYGQKEAHDMKLEDYLSDFFDVIADDPHYAESKPDAFKGHLAYVKTLGWAERRAWLKQIMADNGVLSKNRMAEFRATSEEIMKQLDTKAIQATIALESATEAHEKERLNWHQTEDGYIRDRERVAEERRQSDALKDAELKNLNTLLDKAQQNAQPVEKWTWQQHLSAAVSKLLGGGEPTK